MSRPTCADCSRPLKLCYCNAISPVKNPIKVIILQHPKETKHPFNTGKLAHKCLINSDYYVTADLTKAMLEKIANSASALVYPSLPWLPEVEQITLTHKANRAVKLPAKSQQLLKSIEQIVLIDATWRKSKKVLHDHPQLQNIPRISLKGEFCSNYRIRRSRLKYSLSSIESIYFALKAFDRKTCYENLLSSFELMIDKQIQSHKPSP